MHWKPALHMSKPSKLNTLPDFGFKNSMSSDRYKPLSF
ncbi:Putative protein RFPL3S (fragment) [Agrobacterium tumefaciens str. CFBP 5621]